MTSPVCVCVKGQSAREQAELRAERHGSVGSGQDSGGGESSGGRQVKSVFNEKIRLLVLDSELLRPNVNAADIKSDFDPMWLSAKCYQTCVGSHGLEPLT